MYRITVLFSLFLLAFAGCNREEIEPDWRTDRECVSGVQTLDSIFLDDSTRIMAVNMEHRKIYYRNTDGHIISFERTWETVQHFFVPGLLSLKCRGFNPVVYRCPLENVSREYKNDATGMLIDIHLNVQTTPNTDRFVFVDNLSVSIYDPKTAFNSYINIPVRFRGITEEEYKQYPSYHNAYTYLDSCEINGNTYRNVYRIETYTEEGFKDYYFNSDNLLIRFYDFWGNIWYFDHFE